MEIENPKTIENNQIPMDNNTISINIKNIDFNSAEDALKNGTEIYYENIKKSLPEIPKTDLLLHNFSYKVRIPKNDEINVPTGLDYVIRRGWKFITGEHPIKTKIILNNLNLYFKSGSSTIILGPPGCGTSTLLNAICGRIDNGISGLCQYGGRNINEYKWNRYAILCEQLDDHNAALTVKETFEFSKQCQNGNDKFYENTEVTSLFKKDLKLKTDITVKSLGLDICADTIVGNNLKRGVSGGERRRVTLGEILVGPQRIILLDKFSTGLDSAVTIDIVRMLKNWAKELNGIVIAAMLQPDPEVVNLYDNLILLEKGNITYAGPTNKAIEYFEDLGYKKPRGKDFGSFIAEMGYKSIREDLQPV